MTESRPHGGRFELRGELGSGGMGTVYRVFDRERGEEVALKTLRGDTGRDLYRFKREFRALADLAHPNLVTLFELFMVGDDWMYTMELVDGEPFHTHVRPGGELDEARLRATLPQLVDGLCGLHADGKVHRDLKPSNVLVDRSGRTVILDFGLVADVDMPADLTHEQTAVGTPAYMSPEQSADKPLTARSDWYSVGAMLYEVLVGRRPFEGSAAQILHAKQVSDPAQVLALAPRAPVDLALLCMRLLARDPADRPDDQQVMAALGLTPSPWTLRIAAREAATRPDGREADLELLRRALADSRDHPVCALVTGPRESGKTTLIDAFVAETRARGDVVVFAGRASNREAVPYRAIDRIVDGLASWLLGLPRAEAAALLPPGVSALCRVFPTLRRVPAAQVPTLPGALPTDEVQLRDKAFDALRALIAAIAERHPLVMVADDMQWATPEGVPILDRFLHTKVRCLMLFGLRSDEGNRVLVDHLAAWGGDLRTISLSPVPAVAPE